MCKAWCGSLFGIFPVLLISREIKPLRIVIAVFGKRATTPLLGPFLPTSFGAVTSGCQAAPCALICCCQGWNS